MEHSLLVFLLKSLECYTCPNDADQSSPFNTDQTAPQPSQKSRLPMNTIKILQTRQRISLRQIFTCRYRVSKVIGKIGKMRNACVGYVSSAITTFCFNLIDFHFYIASSAATIRRTVANTTVQWALRQTVLQVSCKCSILPLQVNHISYLGMIIFQSLVNVGSRDQA